MLFLSGGLPENYIINDQYAGVCGVVWCGVRWVRFGVVVCVVLRFVHAVECCVFWVRVETNPFNLHHSIYMSLQRQQQQQHTHPHSQKTHRPAQAHTHNTHILRSLVQYSLCTQCSDLPSEPECVGFGFCLFDECSHHVERVASVDPVLALEMEMWLTHVIPSFSLSLPPHFSPFPFPFTFSLVQCCLLLTITNVFK